MLTKIGINIETVLDGHAGERLRRLLLALPGVKQVTVAYPHRVEVQYDGALIRASSLMAVIRGQGLRTTLK